MLFAVEGPRKTKMPIVSRSGDKSVDNDAVEKRD
jgi:hypothetical protein